MTNSSNCPSALAHLITLMLENLGEQILDHGALAAGELGDEPFRFGPAREIAASRSPAVQPSVRALYIASSLVQTSRDVRT